MSNIEEPDEKMIEACREVFLKHNGTDIRQIEIEMKAAGWDKFNRQYLYTSRTPWRLFIGWIDRRGWNSMLPEEFRKPPGRHAFEAWVNLTFKDWKWSWPYQRYLFDRLRDVTAGRTKRLMLFLPPRHGKTELVTVRYTAWRLLTQPKLNVILGSYNQKLANRFARKIRRIVEPGLPAPGGEGAKAEKKIARRSADEWETGSGGGLRAVGAGGGVTGFGADLVVIDDPVKGRAEAESDAFRERVWDWFNDDIYTRLEPGASVILIQTRWHEDDLAGRLLKEMGEGGEKWEVVSFPALAEAPGGEGESEAVCPNGPERQHSERRAAQPKDQLGRAEGEPLCPERFDRDALLRIKAKLGTYGFSALYQQRPMPAGGGVFKRNWFRNVVDAAPERLRWVRGYDLAISTRTSADYTASFRCAFDRAGNLYIADGFRKRIEYPEQRRYIVERMLAEKDTRHGIEKAMHGLALVQDLRREPKVRFRPLTAVAVDADKLTRALAWANLAEEGKVFLVKGAWTAEFLDEICKFTGKNDRHDDQVDAVSLAVRMLSEGDKRGYGF